MLSGAFPRPFTSQRAELVWSALPPEVYGLTCDRCHSTKPDRVRDAFGQHTWARGVTLGDGPVQGQELDLMVLVSSFQLRILSDFVIYL